MTISTRTRINWAMDFAVFGSALLGSLSGIYFLYFTSGGYQGGRNALYGVTLWFARSTWSDLHVWAGVAMVLAVTIHLVYHWNWVAAMSKKMLKAATTGNSGLSRGGRINLLINLLIGASFLLTAVSGIYFLFIPEGGFQGGTNPGWDPGFLLSRTSWDIVHTWSGVTLILAAIAHFIIHWGWITKVTTRMFTIPSARREPAATVKLS
ncbi:MAG: DUF4405 domain-containing protein [Anaerolineales bacterium]|jgi:hypothetical protein